MMVDYLSLKHLYYNGCLHITIKLQPVIILLHCLVQSSESKPVTPISSSTRDNFFFLLVMFPEFLLPASPTSILCTRLFVFDVSLNGFTCMLLQSLALCGSQTRKAHVVRSHSLDDELNF